MTLNLVRTIQKLRKNPYNTNILSNTRQHQIEPISFTDPVFDIGLDFDEVFVSRIRREGKLRCLRSNARLLADDRWRINGLPSRRIDARDLQGNHLLRENKWLKCIRGNAGLLMKVQWASQSQSRRKGFARESSARRKKEEVEMLEGSNACLFADG